jgi:hypothetical protein
MKNTKNISKIRTNNTRTQAAVDVPPSMRGTASATTMRESGEAAGPPPSMQSMVEEKLSGGLGEED